MCMKDNELWDLLTVGEGTGKAGGLLAQFPGSSGVEAALGAKHCSK